MKIAALLAVIATTLILSGCETLDSDWDFAPMTLPTYNAPSGDNRSNEQRLADAAW